MNFLNGRSRTSTLQNRKMMLGKFISSLIRHFVTHSPKGEGFVLSIIFSVIVGRWRGFRRLQYYQNLLCICRGNPVWSPVYKQYVAIVRTKNFKIISKAIMMVFACRGSRLCATDKNAIEA